MDEAQQPLERNPSLRQEARAILKRFLLIHPEGNSFNNPTLKAFIDECLERGIAIDIRSRDSVAARPAAKGLHWIPYGRVMSRTKRLAHSQRRAGPLLWLLTTLERTILYRPYDLVIGVDRDGLIQARSLARQLHVPYCLFSFEIMFEDETSAEYKAIEREASSGVALWLIQDDQRARALASENGLDMRKAFVCPVASSARVPGAAERRLRDDLGIDPAKRVAITIGSMAHWTMIEAIIRSTRAWPDDWVLILHERFGALRKELREIMDAHGIAPERIYVSPRPIESVDDMGYVLGGASVGLALYDADYSSPYTGKNLAYIGRSSGKIATYLRYRVPVIVNEIGTYANDVRRAGLGAVVRSADDIGATLRAVDWEACAERAYGFFARELCSDLYVPALVSRLEKIAREPASLT